MALDVRIGSVDFFGWASVAVSIVNRTHEHHVYVAQAFVSLHDLADLETEHFR
jgi:hypothetical protein